jgi:type IV pilus assembly protein PilO
MDKYLDQFAKASPAVRYGGIAGVVALLTALNFFFVISSVEETITKQQGTQRKLDLQLAEKTEIAQNLNERRREMDVLEQKLAEALTELPEKTDMDELLSQLNDIGKKSGLEISKVEPGAESNGEFFARIPVRMVVAGNYNEIAMFLQEVSTMRRIVNVSGIKLASPTLVNEKVVLQSSFLATTFRFVEADKAVATKPRKKR